MSEGHFSGPGAVQCGRCKGTGICSTCNGDGSRTPTPAYLEKRQLAIASAEAQNRAQMGYAETKAWYMAQIKAAWPEQWMQCNACANGSGVCPGCQGKGWVRVEPSLFGRNPDSES